MKDEQVKADDVPNKIKEFSGAEIKQRLKNNSKGDLIKIIINLSAKIDAHKEHNEETRDLINLINSNGGFVDYSTYTELINKVDEDV